MVEMLTTPDPAQDAPAPGGYEFNERENVVIRRTGSRSRVWGYLAMAWAVLMIGSAVAAVFFIDRTPAAVAVAAIYGVFGVIPLLVGLNFVKASRSFAGVTETSGLDIPHLMRALESLSSALQVQIVTALLGVLLFGLGVAAAVYFGFSL